MFKATCPSCERSLTSAKEIPQGARLKCPGCGTLFSPVTSAAVTASKPAGKRTVVAHLDDDDDDFAAPRRPAMARSRRDSSDEDDDAPRRSSRSGTKKAAGLNWLLIGGIGAG